MKQFTFLYSCMSLIASGFFAGEKDPNISLFLSWTIIATIFFFPPKNGFTGAVEGLKPPNLDRWQATEHNFVQNAFVTTSLMLTQFGFYSQPGHIIQYHTIGDRFRPLSPVGTVFPRFCKKNGLPN